MTGMTVAGNGGDGRVLAGSSHQTDRTGQEAQDLHRNTVTPRVEVDRLTEQIEDLDRRMTQFQAVPTSGPERPSQSPRMALKAPV